MRDSDIPPYASDLGGLAPHIREQKQRIPTPRTDPPLSELDIPDNADPYPIFINALFDRDAEMEGIRAEVKVFLRAKGWSKLELVQLQKAIKSNLPGLTGRDKAYYILAKQAALKNCVEIHEQAVDILTPVNRNILYNELERIHNNLVESLARMNQRSIS